MMDDQLGCTEEEIASLMKNSNEAAKAQGLEPLNAGRGSGSGSGSGRGSGSGQSPECEAADEIVSKDQQELSTDTAHIAQCYDADSSSDPKAKEPDGMDFTKWIFKKGKGSCSVCSAALKIKFGAKCENKNGDCKHCPFLIDAYKDCDVAPKFAIAHTIALEGISAAAFNEDPKIIASFQSTVATTLGVTTDKIINILANPTRRQLSGRGLAAEGCRYVERG